VEAALIIGLISILCRRQPSIQSLASPRCFKLHRHLGLMFPDLGRRVSALKQSSGCLSIASKMYVSVVHTFRSSLQILHKEAHSIVGSLVKIAFVSRSWITAAQPRHKAPTWSSTSSNPCKGQIQDGTSICT